MLRVASAMASRRAHTAEFLALTPPGANQGRRASPAHPADTALRWADTGAAAFDDQDIEPFTHCTYRELIAQHLRMGSPMLFVLVRTPEGNRHVYAADEGLAWFDVSTHNPNTGLPCRQEDIELHAVLPGAPRQLLRVCSETDIATRSPAGICQPTLLYLSAASCCHKTSYRKHCASATHALVEVGALCTAHSHLTRFNLTPLDLTELGVSWLELTRLDLTACRLQSGLYFSTQFFMILQA